MNDTLHIPEYQIFTTVNSYAKVYPSHTKLILYDQPRRARIPGYELDLQSSTVKSGAPSAINTLEESLRRTKTTIADIIICNKFDLFCTFTFDPKKVNRTDINECKRKMSKWLNRQREKNGKFDYLIVPEFHKDGKALHFHALFKNYNGKLTEANIKHKKNRKVHNIKSYQLGYSTAVEIDGNIEKVGNYVKKYITKDMPLFSGKKRYWCSTRLIRPDVLQNPDIDPFTLAEFTPVYSKKGFDILEKQGTIPTQILNGEPLTWLKPAT